MNYVDASELTLSDMGSMSGMAGFGGGMPKMPDDLDASDIPSDFHGITPKGSEFQQMPGSSEEESSRLNVEETSSTVSGASFQNMTENMPVDIPEGFTGEKPEGFDSSQMPEEFSGGFSGQSPGGTETTPSENSEDSTGTDSSENRRPSGGNMQRPDNFNFDMNGMEASTTGITGWIYITVSVLILGAGLIIAKLYKYHELGTSISILCMSFSSMKPRKPGRSLLILPKACSRSARACRISPRAFSYN